MTTSPRDESVSLTRSLAVELDSALTETDWSALPKGTVKRPLRVPSGTVSHVSLGPQEGDRVLLVPGVTGSKEDFTLMMPLFARAGFLVESFDLAGQFESFRAGPENVSPPQSRYQFELFVDDLLAVINAGKTPLHLLGYSFAGTVSTLATIQQPHLVKTLTLLSTPPIPGQVFRHVKRMGWLSSLIPIGLLGPLFIAALRHNVHRAPRDRAVFVTERLQHTRASSVTDVLRLMKATPDTALLLRETGIPMLIAAGTGDLWPSDAHRAFADRIGAKSLILPTGHGPCETTPHQLTASMLELFSEAEPEQSFSRP